MRTAIQAMSYKILREYAAGPVSDLTFSDVQDDGTIRRILEAGGLVRVNLRNGVLRWERGEHPSRDVRSDEGSVG